MGVSGATLSPCPRDGSYDTAQVCRNGHVITRAFWDYPHHRSKHCSECGTPTVTTCKHCDSEIPGHLRGVMPSLHEEPPPSYCQECGAAYPWTASALAAAEELTDALETLKPEEREQLRNGLPDLMRDTPRTPVAVVQTKRLLAKAGGAAGQALVKILTEIATDAAKKGLGL